MMDDEGVVLRADIPDKLKALRACMRCGLVKTYEQFYNTGCENCPFLGMEQETGAVHMYTSGVFEGLIAMVEPEGSWVARWQRIDKLNPGMYAVKVVGQLPEETRDMCETNGYYYVTKPNA